MRMLQVRPLTLAVASLAAALILCLFPGGVQASVDGDAMRPLMRYPTVSGDWVVFSYGGDLWRAPVAGGSASRITVDDGDETLARFSPDGEWLAFTAQIDGDRDVYVMRPDGSGIRRVTYYPATDRVVGWNPASGKILFSSARGSNASTLWEIEPDGSGLEELPLHEGAWGSISADGSRIAYNRVAREHRTWKRYRGGLAQDVYLYDFASREDRRLTDFDGTDRLPMWIGDAVYFASDRDRRLNLYRVDPASGQTEKVTHHTDYDVRRPSSDGSRIVYELGGTLWLYDPAAGDSRQLAISIRPDAPEARPYVEDVSDELQGGAISPSGARMAVVARGEIFSVPKEHGPTRNLSANAGARDRYPAFSHDGRWLAYLSDADGEYQIWRVDARGGEPEKLTDLPPAFRHTLRWSPDSSKIAFADMTLRLHYLDVASRQVTEVDRATQEPMDIAIDEKPIHDFEWSPDSRFLTYSKINDDLVSQVWIYSLEDGEARSVSNGLFNDFGPVFTRDGRHLLMLSQRHFDPTFGDFEWEMVFKNTTGIYALTLASDGERLLPLRSDEEPVEEAEDSSDTAAEKPRGKRAGGKKAAASADAPDEDGVRIDFDGIARRIEALPVEAGNYRDLAAGDGAVFYLNGDGGDFNRIDLRGSGRRSVGVFSFDDREAETVVEGVAAYSLSADGSHLAVAQTNGRLGLVRSSARDAKPRPLDLSGLRMRIDPREEWRQIYREAWRMERDFFYDPNHHGLDWDAIGDQYESLLPYASSRSDVGYLIGEMIGELNTSHTYVFGGQRRREAERVRIGLLGADYELDEASDRYRFSRILDVGDWHGGAQPPLAGPGIGVEAGDYLLAVDGESVSGDRNLYSYFVDKAGQQVTLTVADDAAGAGERDVVVETVRSERTFRYLDWVESNRRRVDEASGGKLGYVHLPDTFTGSAENFPRLFYVQTRKKGLVVDGRFNGGGLDPDIFLQRLAKRPLAYWTRRYSNHFHNPLVATRAHMALITNRQAGSGGDMLPAQFRQLGLGPVIGTRSWGGLVGVSMFLEMIDGGGLTAPDYRVYDEEGRWIIENVGVEPDMVVPLDPAEMADGHDAQLEAAIEYLLGEIEKEPLDWPENEPPPTGI